MPPDIDANAAWPVGMLALVPVFNHREQVGRVVTGLRAQGAPVLVVDDGSTDGSGEVAAAAGAEVHRLPQNRGKGAALLAGLELAAARGFRQALTCDADGQHPPVAVTTLAAAGGDAAAIHIGRRCMTGAPAASRFGRWWSNLWVWICTGWWVGDSQSGLRIYPLPSTAKLPVRAGRYAWEVEVLVRAAWAGLPVRHVAVPVIYPPDRVSHFHAFKDNVRTAFAFTRLVTRRLTPWPHARLVPRQRPRWRDAFAGNLESPGQVAAACALGAAMGIAPLPGLQMAVAAGLAWRLRLNVALTLVVSNHSFGPMLAVWYAVGTALGLRLLSGQPVLEAFHSLHARLSAASGWRELLAPLQECLAAWLLGCALLMPALALVAGIAGWAVGWIVQRRRTPPRDG